MKPSNRLSPYPVLASYRDDYENASFETTIEAIQQFGDVRLNISFQLDEPDIATLIANGDAEYAIHIECPPSSYRKCASTRDGIFTATLDRLQVRDVVEVCTYVVAARSIRSFSSRNFHPDYEGLAFDIAEGCVLAIGECEQVVIKNEDDIAQRSSIINVTKAGAGQQDALAVNTDQSDCILVTLRPDLYKVYAELGGGPDKDLILSLVILPALQAVLTRMIEAGTDSADAEMEWFRTINEILDRNGIALSELDYDSENKSTLSIAQRILSQPLDRALTGLIREA